VREYLWDADSVMRVEDQHSIDEVLAFKTQELLHLRRVHK
jgi:hypothetical protein